MPQSPVTQAIEKLIQHATELLEQNSADPLTEAQTNLKASFAAAKEYVHEENSDPEIVSVIAGQATLINSYLGNINPPSDVSLQAYADGLSAVVPS